MLGASTFCSSRKTKREILSQPPAPGGFTSNPLPAGSASGLSETWITQAGVERWMFYLSSAPQSDDISAYTYYYYISNPATLALVLSSVQAGTWYGRVAPIQSGIIGLLSQETVIVTA